MSTPIPSAVVRAYGLTGDVQSVPIGWINQTLLVWRGEERLVLQRLHEIFTAEVNTDIDAVTRALEARGLLTPRIVPTLEGALCIEAEGVWRALSFIPGSTLEALDTPALARSAGALVGRFHRALSTLEHDFAFTRPGAHDTLAHLAKLDDLLGTGVDAEADALAEEVLEAGRALPAIEALPTRIIHGDLKATNLRFDEAGTEAIALLDLDTLQRGTLAVELGDALRSWCNRSDEADPGAVFDRAVFSAALEGYVGCARSEVSDLELRSIVPGVETIAVELASRFAADVYEDRYFGWDEARFESRRAHNVARTRGQLSLARSIRSQRGVLSDEVERLLTPPR